MTTAAASPKERFLADFKAAEKDLPGSGLSWVEARRRRALDRFEDLGLPNDKTEDWRFTPVAPLVDKPFSLSAAAPKGFDASKLALREFESYRLVFVNGRYAVNLGRKLPQGVVLGNIAGLIKSSPKLLEPHFGRAGEGHAFNALNTALFQDGAALIMPKGAKLDLPVHLLFVSTAGAASYTRVLVVAEEGSSATLVEEYAGEGDYLSNGATELILGEGARVEHIRLQRESPQARRVDALRARLSRNAALSAHSVALGAAFSRSDAEIKLEGEGAECSLNGLYVLDGAQHCDNNTVIQHAKPHGTSRELYKGVLDGRSRAVFNGAIVVDKDAQKTSATVYNKNLLLSENGLVNTKPVFKINANDVQCRHGATIGQLSADALFYLRSRGIDPAAARAMLVYAFASEMVDALPLPELREALADALHARLPEPV